MSDGSTQGFDITITNKGPSNISSLYLFDNVDATPVYVNSSRAGCPTEGQQFSCSFGALTKGQSITVRVAYDVSGDANGEYKIDFEINTTGVVAGGNNSHGDALVSKQIVKVIPRDYKRVLVAEAKARAEKREPRFAELVGAVNG